jgi:hypothetical protein
MIYVLIFLHFVNTDHLRHYQIGSYGDLESCEIEKEKAGIMVTHSSMALTCLPVNPQQ